MRMVAIAHRFKPVANWFKPAAKAENKLAMLALKRSRMDTVQSPCRPTADGGWLAAVGGRRSSEFLLRFWGWGSGIGVLLPNPYSLFPVPQQLKEKSRVSTVISHKK